MSRSYLFWLFPALTVAAAVASGRIGTTPAAFLGLIAAIPVAAFTGPVEFAVGQLMVALARGLWIGLTIAPYILGGLFFWQIVVPGARPGAQRALPAAQPSPTASLAQRRLLFFACFLIGPFAESATGFGVGMLGTIALVRHLGIAPRHLMVFALMSQTLIPWGGMGSGTMLAAAYARLPANEIGFYSALPTALLMLVWLPLFWRTAATAGFTASRQECLREAAWIAAGLGLLSAATLYLGPEAALLAIYGPLIAIYYLRDQKPSLQQALATARQLLPFALLIGGLALSRLSPALQNTLASTAAVAPFSDLPAWPPLYHAGSWLLAGGLLTALWQGRARSLAQEAISAWKTGKPAVLAVFLFAMMAEVLSAGGISQAIANGMFSALHQGALILTPLLSGAFGILTNSGNAPNSLFMSSQLALAIKAGLGIPAVAALQHVSGTSMSLFSPVRMSIAASLAHGHGQERAVYATLLPYAAFCFALLVLMACAVVI
ncbi:MAG: hypothetical protein GX772_08545 [Alcaligenaceae bacterium]|nr:hypothetical protein [Alcaligenaceae bacterium]